MTTKPLAGVRVLDLGRLFAAPWASQTLADLGADVIKVERIDGDEMRYYGPPYLKDRNGRELQDSPYSLAVNRNKRSIAVDLNKPEGVDLVRRLALASDVVVENFKVGDLKRRGLDHDTLKKLKPDLVYCSLTGFGQDGPYARRPAVDTGFQAMSGLMSVTGEPEGEPQKVGMVITDLIAGLYATIAVLAALRHREVNRGPGQHIDLALLDTSVATLSHRVMEYFMSGETPYRAGNGSPGNIPARTFRCKEGIIGVQAGGDAQFPKLCRALKREDLLADERYKTRRARAANEASLLAILREIFVTKTAAEWFVELGPEGVYCGPVNTIPETMRDPQVKHRGMQVTVPHPETGEIDLLASPLRFSETPLGTATAPPLIGQHTAEVLKGVLNMDDAEIARLAAARVVNLGGPRYAA